MVNYELHSDKMKEIHSKKSTDDSDIRKALANIIKADDEEADEGEAKDEQGEEVKKEQEAGKVYDSVKEGAAE